MMAFFGHGLRGQRFSARYLHPADFRPRSENWGMREINERKGLWQKMTHLHLCQGIGEWNLVRSLGTKAGGSVSEVNL